MNTLPKIVHRYANRYAVSQGNCTWYFSYSTCVAFERLDGKDSVRIRRDRNYSRTTAKHMGQMSVGNWEKVDDATFERLAGEMPR
jgi:hypothetical protein